MSGTAEAILLAVLVLTTSVWVGGYVAIAVVVRAATLTLDSQNRVAFFRSLGRAYLWIGSPALVIALGTGAVLARDHAWDGLLITTATVAAVLMALLIVAIAQARRMTRLRQRFLEATEDKHLAAQVRWGARAAGILRVALGLFSVALVVLGSLLAI